MERREPPVEGPQVVGEPLETVDGVRVPAQQNVGAVLAQRGQPVGADQNRGCI
jgi:hypothetical protein